MSEIKIDLSTENSFSQNQQTKTVPLAKLPQKTAVLQGSVPASLVQKDSFQHLVSAQDNVQISSSAQFIQKNILQNTKTPAVQNSGFSLANAQSIPLQNGTLSLVQNNNAITSSYQRNNGTQFQFTINQNINLQENDDYSASIFFEQENISKKYHADGKISQYQGNILDSNKKSVHINSKGGTINANNDTVIALADKTTINARGNNTIILKENLTDVSINTQNGNNTIMGQEIQNAAISLAAGKNVLNFKNTNNSTINAKNSNVQLNTGKLISSSINLEKGTHSINLQESLHNSIQFESNSFNQESKLNIFGKTENTLIYATGEKTSLTLQNSKDNYIDSAAKFTHAKLYHSKNDAIRIGSYSSTVNAGTLADAAMQIESSQSANLQSNVIEGNSNLSVSAYSVSLSANAVTGGSAVMLDAGHFAQTQLQTVADTAAVNINSAHYTTLQAGTIKDNAHANILGDGTVTVNALKDNAVLHIGSDKTAVGIGAISDNAFVLGADNALQSTIEANTVNTIAEMSPAFAPASSANSLEQTRALTAYINTVNNKSPNQHNQLPLNRLV